jgi:hypothetical protein
MGLRGYHMGEQLNPVCVYFACMGIAVLETDHLLRFSVKGLGYRDESGGCDLAICVRSLSGGAS